MIYTEEHNDVSIKVFNILNKLLLKQIDGDFINKAILLSFRHLN